jgi:4-aminobutyrate aminotransferase-like enzyme
VLENVLALEAAGTAALSGLQERFPSVGDGRSVGCFQAIELVTDRATKDRDATGQRELAERLAARGILADSSTTSLNIQPSLVLPVETLEMAYGVIDEELAAIGGPA